VEVDHGSRQVSVPQVLLNQFDADTRFEKMGCVAMPKRMCADSTLVPIELFENSFYDTLNRRLAHGLFGRRSLQVISAFGRKDPILIAMGLVVIPQDVQSGFWQRDHSILGPFASVDMYQHAFGVDVRNL